MFLFGPSSLDIQIPNLRFRPCFLGGPVIPPTSGGGPGCLGICPFVGGDLRDTTRCLKLPELFATGGSKYISSDRPRDGFPPITGVCCFSRVGKMFGFVWMNVLFWHHVGRWSLIITSPFIW